MVDHGVDQMEKVSNARKVVEKQLGMNFQQSEYVETQT